MEIVDFTISMMYARTYTIDLYLHFANRFMTFYTPGITVLAWYFELLYSDCKYSSLTGSFDMTTNEGSGAGVGVVTSLSSDMSCDYVSDLILPAPG